MSPPKDEVLEALLNLRRILVAMPDELPTESAAAPEPAGAAASPEQPKFTNRLVNSNAAATEPNSGEHSA
jgi:hypothetical protein